jgi:hypothetical protein
MKKGILAICWEFTVLLTLRLEGTKEEIGDGFQFKIIWNKLKE